ncbi:hypothetical protein PS2_044870 [Malus domestica]
MKEKYHAQEVYKISMRWLKDLIILHFSVSLLIVNQSTSKKQCRILSEGKQWMKKSKQFRKMIHGNSLYFRKDTKPSESSGCTRQRKMPIERSKDDETSGEML